MISLACPPTDPLVLIATAHALVPVHRTPSFYHKTSTRVSRKGSASRNFPLPWTPFLEINPDPCPRSCGTVCSLASTSTVFSMASLRRGYFRPCPHGRLHVDPRTKRRTLVRAGRGPDTSTPSCNIMAGLGCTDHDVADCAQSLLADKVFRARHLGRRCDAEVSTMGHGHGVGQSLPSCLIAFSDSLNRCAKDS